MNTIKVVFIEEYFPGHIDHLIIVFGGFIREVLKFKACKFSFGFEDIPRLGFFITRDVIKPYPKKFIGTVYLGRSTTTMKSHAPIGIFH